MVRKTISREQLEQIIREELMKEGMLDRFMARTKGNASALKALGQRGVQAVKLVATGKVDATKLQDPKLAKATTMAVERIKGYEKKFQKIMFDMSNDLQLMFGQDFEKAPGLQTSINKVDQLSELFAQYLKKIGAEIEARFSIENAKLMNKNTNQPLDLSKVRFDKQGKIQ